MGVTIGFMNFWGLGWFDVNDHVYVVVIVDG